MSATVESPSSTGGVCSPTPSVSHLAPGSAFDPSGSSRSKPILFTVTRPSASPCASPVATHQFGHDSRRSSLSSSSSPLSTSALPSFADTYHSNAPSAERFRSRSLFSPSSTQSAAMASINQQPNLPAPDLAATRSAQLALLAEQARMASVGTSSLRIARAQSIVVLDAMRSTADGSSSSSALVKSQPVSPTSPLSPTTSKRKLTLNSSHAADEDAAKEQDVSMETSQGANPSSDVAWQQVVTSPEFLPSASSLAQLFQAQEQNRLVWAGEALALQRRRWTMAPDTSSRPSLAQITKCNSDEHLEIKKRANFGEDTQFAAGDDEDRNAKKRRMNSSERRQENKKRDRRVSFATGTLGGADDQEDEEGEDDNDKDDHERKHGGQTGNETSEKVNPPAAPSSSVAAAAAPEDVDMEAVQTEESQTQTDVITEPTIEDGAIVKRSVQDSSSPSSPISSSRPRLLENVLTSFASLLDSRKEACAGLAELAKNGEEVVIAANAVAASRASSRAPSRACSPGARRRSSSGHSNAVSGRPLSMETRSDYMTSHDTSALDTDTSDEDDGEEDGSMILSVSDSLGREDEDSEAAQVEAEAEAAMASLAEKDRRTID
ncbi:unnamed protein product [Sympodiomycopsis kandeliae]